MKKNNNDLPIFLMLKKAVFAGCIVAVISLFFVSLASINPTSVSASPFACESVKADLWFGNDESGSVDSSEFNDALDFMYQISDSFDYDATTGVQAGAYAWDTSANNVIIPITEDFADTDDTGLISDANIFTDGDSIGVRELYTSKAGGGGTDLTVATQHMADLINGGNGRRADVPQIAIILTDASESQLTGDAANWIVAGDNLRAAGEGDVGVVLVLIAEAATAYNSGSAKPTVDSVAGTDGLVVTVPTYSEAADPAQGHIESVTTAICDTIEFIAPSGDNDNVAPEEEDGGPNGGDGNNDGTIDSLQPNVTTASNNVIDAYTTTQIGGDCDQVTAVNFYAESELSVSDADYEYPFGLHGFTVDCTANGGTVDVTYFWDQEYDVSNWTYRKFNPSTNTYINFDDLVTYGTANIGGATVTTVSYSVTDGGLYDGDGLENGSILDPVGPSVLGVSSPDTGFGIDSSVSPYVFISTGLVLIIGTGVYYGRRTRGITVSKNKP